MPRVFSRIARVKRTYESEIEPDEWDTDQAQASCALKKEKQELLQTCTYNAKSGDWTSEKRLTKNNVRNTDISVNDVDNCCLRDGTQTLDEEETVNANRSDTDKSGLLLVLGIKSKDYSCGEKRKKLLSQERQRKKISNIEEYISKNKDGKYMCRICDKSFKHLYTLTRHIPIHTGERKHVCNVCGKTFTQSSTLCRHKVVHTKEYNYDCHMCGKAFGRSSSLSSHMKTHSNETRFSCSICNKGFHQKINLKNHLYTHTGEKPFKCTMCDTTFTQKSNLVSHIGYIHSSSLKCLLCHKTFTRRKYLVEHEKLFHGQFISSRSSDSIQENILAAKTAKIDQKLVTKHGRPSYTGKMKTITLENGLKTFIIDGEKHILEPKFEKPLQYPRQEPKKIYKVTCKLTPTGDSKQCSSGGASQKHLEHIMSEDISEASSVLKGSPLLKKNANTENKLSKRLDNSKPGDSHTKLIRSNQIYMLTTKPDGTRLLTPVTVNKQNIDIDIIPTRNTLGYTSEAKLCSSYCIGQLGDGTDQSKEVHSASDQYVNAATPTSQQESVSAETHKQQNHFVAAAILQDAEMENLRDVPDQSETVLQTTHELVPIAIKPKEKCSTDLNQRDVLIGGGHTVAGEPRDRSLSELLKALADHVSNQTHYSSSVADSSSCTKTTELAVATDNSSSSDFDKSFENFLNLQTLANCSDFASSLVMEQNQTLSVSTSCNQNAMEFNDSVDKC